MKKIVVTGVTGLIGKSLVNLLLSKGYFVYGIVRKGSLKKIPFDDNPNYRKIECDLENLCELYRLIGEDCYALFHLAWDGSRGPARNDASLQRKNYCYSMAALEQAVNLNCAYFIGAGSQAEYGVISGIISEATNPNPNTQYGIYKLKFTEDALRYLENKPTRLIMPRFFSLYGKNDYPNTILQSTIVKMLRNEPCALTECCQLWNFMYVEDAVNALVYLMEKEYIGIFNFASDDTRELKSFVEDLKTMTGTTSKLLYGAISYPQSGKVSINPDTSKLFLTGFKILYSFTDGVKEIIAEEKQKLGTKGLL